MTRRCFLPWTARLTLAIVQFSCCGRGLEPELTTDARRVGRRDLGGAGEAPATVWALLLEDVVHALRATTDLARCGDLEPGGGALVRLHLRHGGYSSVLAAGTSVTCGVSGEASS